jgi:hypothetical protein
MPCDPTECQASLRWALKDGSDPGDADFVIRRNEMTKAAVDRNATSMGKAGYDMFRRHHEQEGANIQSCCNERPNDVIKWARDILGI